MLMLFITYSWLTVLVIFFFNDTATTEIYTLSLHDALPIYTGERRLDRIGGAQMRPMFSGGFVEGEQCLSILRQTFTGDRKSTRLNSSHANISYAVFCLKKKNTK